MAGALVAGVSLWNVRTAPSRMDAKVAQLAAAQEESEAAAKVQVREDTDLQAKARGDRTTKRILREHTVERQTTRDEFLHATVDVTGARDAAYARRGERTAYLPVIAGVVLALIGLVLARRKT